MALSKYDAEANEFAWLQAISEHRHTELRLQASADGLAYRRGYRGGTCALSVALCAVAFPGAVWLTEQLWNRDDATRICQVSVWFRDTSSSYTLALAEHLDAYVHTCRHAFQSCRNC